MILGYHFKRIVHETHRNTLTFLSHLQHKTVFFFIFISILDQNIHGPLTGCTDTEGRGVIRE